MEVIVSVSLKQSFLHQIVEQPVAATCKYTQATWYLLQKDYILNYIKLQSVWTDLGISSFNKTPCSISVLQPTESEAD